jgi:hypothetical protein
VARAFALYDYVDDTKSGPVLASGACAHTWGPPDLSHLWVVSLIGVFSTSALNGPAGLYLDDATVPSNFRGGTRTGIGDTDTNAGLLVPSGRSLLIVWAGLTPGAVCTSVLQYRDMIGTAVPSDNAITVAAMAGAGS